MVYEAQAGGAGVDETASPVTPTETRDGHRKEESHADNELQVPAVLPPDNLVLAQVTDVSDTRLATRLNDHPANVRPPETQMRVVRVELGVGVSVVRTVTTGPPLDRAFDCTGTRRGESILERLRRVVRAVSPEAVVARRNT